MPRKNSDKTYGEKLITLFARLLFTRERHSLSDLAQMLDCSKQTVLRLVEDIERSYKVQIEWSMEGRRRFFLLKTLDQQPPMLNLTATELNALYMCRSFAEHLLGRGFLEEATRALEKGRAFIPENTGFSSHHFASFRPGTIDYTPHQEAIRILLEAMEKKRICKISYRTVMGKESKRFYVKPYRLFSHQDTVYLHAGHAGKPGARYKPPRFDPLLAVHRIKKVDLDERFFKIPEDYDFEKTFNRNFGIIKAEAFDVTVEFSGFAAGFVAERIWSPDQEIKPLSGGKIHLSFSASSEPELLAWILSFGDEARLLDPDWLVEEVKTRVGRMTKKYIG
ncbi:MAG: WYL domain-containing protein [Deltaproteobacteria bacterium]|nr:WYL domain-containing protein [Deltaproteobacteria bacterium]